MPSGPSATIPRSSLLTTAATGLAVAGCGGAETQPGPARARTVRHALGTTRVPARHSRVATDIIVSAAYVGEAPQVKELETNPLWDSLPAVRADRVATVPGEVYNGGTYVAAQLLVEALVDTIQGGG